jgi:predicted lipoprotein with Yx(FWY)xxD motif
VVVTGDSQFGPMLFDRSGQAIYLFDKETTSTPRCYGACAEAWPPVLTSGPPRARRGADVSLLGTVRRRDGRTQVTYDGHPLYFYAHEGKHQVLCHDVLEYGGLWLVVTPEGPPAPSAG